MQHHSMSCINHWIILYNSSFFSQGGDDFVSQQYQLDFPAGQTRSEFTVAITDDSMIEATESFQLLLSIPEDLISKGVQVGSNSAATVTIMDNDGELYSTSQLCAFLLHIHVLLY